MTRVILPSSSIRPALFCRRPAVSTSTTSIPSARPVRTASNATAAGSAPSRSERTVCTPTREPQVWSWSAAAARNVSAAPRTTVRPSATSTRASLPTVVVLPVPFTPTTSTTAGTRDPSAAAPGAVCRLRSRVGSTSAISCSRRSARTWAGSLRPSTRTRVRRASMSSPVGPAPTSASRSVSSSSSQSSSVRWSLDRTASSRAPRGEPDLESRSRSRASRPATGRGHLEDRRCLGLLGDHLHRGRRSPRSVGRVSASRCGRGDRLVEGGRGLVAWPDRGAGGRAGSSRATTMASGMPADRRISSVSLVTGTVWLAAGSGREPARQRDERPASVSGRGGRAGRRWPSPWRAGGWPPGRPPGGTPRPRRPSPAGTGRARGRRARRRPPRPRPAGRHRGSSRPVHPLRNVASGDSRLSFAAA